MEQQKQTDTREAPVMIFNDGVIYFAHTTDPSSRHRSWLGNVGFHTAVFYRESGNKYIIASCREYVNQSYKKGEIDKIVSKEGIERICFNILEGVLRNDPAKGWYQYKTFVPGERHNESIANYLKKHGQNADFTNIIVKETYTPSTN